MSDIIPESGLGPQNGRWRQWVERSIMGLKSGLSSSRSDTANSFKATNSSLELLTKQVAALPVPKGFYVKSTGFGLASILYVQQSVPVPAGKTKVLFTAIGNVSVLDVTSGGVAVAQSTIEVNGSGFLWSSPQITASKDAGASVVVNNITPALGFQQDGLTPGGNFLVSLNVSATNPAAFPVRAQNFATLTISAIFFD